MKTVLLALALTFGFAGASFAQQMDGKNCEFAYKKLQQHRAYGYCNEQGSDAQQGKDFTERGAPKGEHSIRDRVTDAFDRLFD